MTEVGDNKYCEIVDKIRDKYGKSWVVPRAGVEYLSVFRIDPTLARLGSGKYNNVNYNIIQYSN